MAESTGVAILFRAEIPRVPEVAPVIETYRGQAFQMLAPAELPRLKMPEVEVLGPADAEDMLALTKLTEPGPYGVRTPELGTYVGVREQGRLVAMAGERFCWPGFGEISAVCTHPDVRGQGLGAALTIWMANHIVGRGDAAFLHVVSDNTSAKALYERLGFTVRRTVEVAVYFPKPNP